METLPFINAFATKKFVIILFTFFSYSLKKNASTHTKIGQTKHFLCVFHCLILRCRNFFCVCALSELTPTQNQVNVILIGVIPSNAVTQRVKNLINAKIYEHQIIRCCYPFQSLTVNCEIKSQNRRGFDLRLKMLISRLCCLFFRRPMFE